MSKNKTVRNVFFTVFCLFACISLGYAESCSSVGSEQDKYVANEPDFCSYRKYTRTCCSNGSWSEWDGECLKCMGNRPSGSCGPGNCGEVVGECNEISGTWVTKCNMDKCPKWYQIYKASRKAFTLSGSCDSIAGANQKCKEAADGENGYCPNGTAGGQVCFPEGSSCILGARNYSLQTASSTLTIKSCECWIHYAGELQCRK